MKQRLIIKTGSPHPAIQARHGGFEQWIARELGAQAAQWQVIDVAAGATLPAPERVAAAIVTGSPAMVSDRAAWSEATAAWLRAAHQLQLPLLGICFGHQLLAYALGGEVGYHPQGPEAGSVTLQCLPAAAADPLFAGLPQAFAANVLHWQSVLTLPPGAQLLACSAHEPHQAFRLGESWGVQFHPEFDRDTTAALLQQLAPALTSDGWQPGTADDTPHAASLLSRFAALANARAAMLPIFHEEEDTCSMHCCSSH